MTVTQIGLATREGAKTVRTTYSGAIAAELRAIMARRMASSSELAKALGVSPMYISRRMTGRTPFDAEELAAVAQLLGVTVADLLPAPGTFEDPIVSVKARKPAPNGAGNGLPGLDSNQRPAGYLSEELWAA